MFTDDGPSERLLGFVAEDGGDVVGAGMLHLPMLDNEHYAWLMTWVAPALRGRGTGSALLDHLVREARALGRTDLVVETAYPAGRREDHPYRRFLERRGFVLANTEVRRVLELPVPDAELQVLIDESAARHEGYRIVAFDGPVPDELLPSLCATKSQLAVDAPTGAMDFEEEAFTPELLRHHDEVLRRQGRTRISTLALTAMGEVVAYSDIVIPSGDLPNVYQWGTLVRREHRGHRLGTAVKARGLRELQRRVGPERTRIQTCNAEQNPWMVGINERLGYRAVEVVPSFLRRVEALVPAASQRGDAMSTA